ncbi:hypothetical protein RXV95_03745 [Novosphingobium sp. ZN18A2]|uniref:hypothetical protein n=1 Tax=Novosphingobium sp. ZN18A2 TaxID=3079861 RepID=UPI0030CCFA83
MIARAGSGWQTVLADLALILFMVTGSALARARPGGDGATLRGEAVAVWREGKGSPPFGRWLADADPRTRATLTVRYGADGPRAALERARALAQAAGSRASTMRILVEPGDGPGAEAVLAYDAQPLARGLQRSGQIQSNREQKR